MTVAEDLTVEGCALREGTTADAVGQRVPGLVACPGDAEALSRVMSAAAKAGLAVAARGNGTASDWGGELKRLDLLVDTTALSWIDHNAGDLVVEVGAGTPMAELYEVLSGAEQRLPYDPVRAEGTVGGAVATGVSGPRRLITGALRDLVIGMRVVRPDGVTAHTGGRVVKNVAGYDLAKLHTGGMGTLGVIASVAFRLHPEPSALRVVSADPGSRQETEHALAALRRTTVVPSAVEIDEGLGLHAVLEGTPAGLRERVSGAERALGPTSTVTEALPDGWGLLPAEGTLALVSVPPAESAAAVADLGTHTRGASARLTGSAARGSLYMAFPPGTPAEAVAAAVEQGRSRPGWSVTLLRAEEHVRAAGTDLWGEVPGLALMRAVKDSFDPDRRMAPGRFAGGL